jgi:Mg2+/citrate symporter
MLQLLHPVRCQTKTPVTPAYAQCQEQLRRPRLLWINTMTQEPAAAAAAAAYAATFSFAAGAGAALVLRYCDTWSANS